MAKCNQSLCQSAEKNHLFFNQVKKILRVVLAKIRNIEEVVPHR